MIAVAVVGAAVVVAVLCWLIQQAAGRGFHRYQQAFKVEASERMGEFFLFLDPAQLWVANLGLCAATVVATYLLFGAGWIAAASGIVALIAPQVLIRRIRQQRLRRFDEQLPDLLMALSGALRAGSAIQVALRDIVPRSPPPLGQEFGLVLRQQRMGVPMEESLASLYARMPTEGTGLVVSSLKIAVRSGGSLAETLERIAATLRARLHLIGRVHALTSQGRLQAWVMACLPLLLALVLQYLDPESMRILWETPLGWGVIAVIVLLESVGMLLIFRIVDIQV